MEAMEFLSNIFNSDKILQIASTAHMYVACEGEKIVGTGSISSFWGSKIIEALENDEFFLRAKRIEIPASITACKFYEKMGYTYKNGKKELDEEGHYRMEKFR